MKLENLRISNTDKLALIGNMSTMLNAGIPIREIVLSLLEDSKGNLKQILTVMLDDLMQGKQISTTLAKFPKVFEKVTVNVIKASEEAGTLDIVLKDLRKSILRDIEFMDRVKTALVYPVFIAIVFIMVLVMILVVVVPKIKLVFGRLKTELPLPTKILIFLSDILVEHTLILIACLAALIVLLIFFYRRYQKKFTELLFSLPLITLLVQQIDITRLTRSLYLLLSSGLPIVSALDLAREIVFKAKTAKVLENCRDMVFSGKTLSEGLKLTRGYIPSIMIKLVEVGEKTGSLDKSMQEISEFFDFQVSSTLKTVTTLLEPILLVVVGATVGAMMLSIIAPIYGLIGQVGSN